MKLIIAEKPSVGQTIAKVVKADVRLDGYLEGKDYIVSWCYGHLVGLSAPNAYGENYEKWNLDELPIIPEYWKTEIFKSTSKQYKIIKELISRNDVDEIICATDAGREGELIFRLLYDKIGLKKPYKRLWISSMEDEAIKNGINNLKEGKEFENLYQSAITRAKADWLVGFNLTRFYTCLYNVQGLTLTVGRVQTPTLNLIVDRDNNINNFKKEKYYTVDIETEDFSLSTDRIDDLEEAERINNLLGSAIEVTDIVQKKKITKPDLPFDLTTLQRECNKYFGYSAKQTLDYAQSLYEKKYITYPRTDSRYLTVDMIESTVNNIIRNNDFDTERIKVVFNSEKVTDHHAIIPTVSSMSSDISKLSEEDKNVYALILNKLYASFSYPLIENTIKIIANFDTCVFTSFIKKIEDVGFTKYLKSYSSNENKEKMFPDVKIGDFLVIKKKETKEKFTKPPDHFTEDTLLKTMELAGNDAIEKDIDVERKGLGTPATRASIIEKLIENKYVIRDKKNLISTETGKQLISIVPENIKSPKTTAEWENNLALISCGKYDSNVFLQDIAGEIKKIIKMDNKIKTNFNSEEVLEYIVGKCPRCGGNVIKKNKVYTCDNNCGFIVFKDNKWFKNVVGKAVNDNLLKAILEDGKVKMKGLKSKRGNTFTAYIKIVDTGKYINFELEFGD